MSSPPTSTLSGIVLHIGLLTGTLPMLFGPYASQLVLLTNELQQHGHIVSWLSVNKNAGEYVPPEYNVTVLPITPREKNTGQPVYVSAINDFCGDNRIDAIISLGDLNRIFVDESFVVPSISWFPNHFVKLDRGSRFALSAFDAVASLAPSDALSIAEQLPHKHVVHVPHVIEPPPILAKKGVLRRKYGVPKDGFVVLVMFANYAGNSDRKAPDVALLAFKELHRQHPRAFLYIHSIGMSHISRGAVTEDGISLPGLISMVGLEQGSFTLSSSDRPHRELAELMKMSDVTLERFKPTRPPPCKPEPCPQLSPR